CELLTIAQRCNCARKPALSDRRFRAPFDLGSLNLHLEFNYPLSVLAYEVPASYDLTDITRSVITAFGDADFEQGPVQTPDRENRVHRYIAVENSPLLRSSAFVEYEVGQCVYRRMGRYPFFFDSQGTIPDGLSDLTQVSADLLRTVRRCQSEDDERDSPEHRP